MKECFLKPQWLDKKFENTPSLVMNGNYVEHFYVLLQLHMPSQIYDSK